MKHVTLAIALFSTLLFGENAYRPINEALEQAKESRAAFIRITGEAQRLAPTWSTPDQLFPYLNALNEFAELEKKLDAGTLGAGPTKALAAALTKTALKWLDFEKVDSTSLESFLRWADDDTRIVGIEAAHRSLTQIDDKEKLLKFYENVRFTISKCEEFKVKANVLSTADAVQGAVARRILAKSSELNPNLVTRILKETTGVIAIAEVADYLKQDLALSETLDNFKRIFYQAFILAENTANSKIFIPGYVRNEVDALLIDSLQRVLGSKGTVSKNDVERIPGLMQADSVLALSSMLIDLYEERQIPSSQVETVAPLFKAVGKYLAKYGFDKPSKEFAKLANRLNVASLYKNGNYEGTYDVLIDKKRTATLTIVDTGESNFIMCLSEPNQKVENLYRDYNFYFVSYDLDRDRWQAHRVEVGSSKYRAAPMAQWFFDFNFGSTNDVPTLDGTFFDGEFFVSFAAKKRASYGTYNEAPAQGDIPPRYLMGTYWTYLDKNTPFGISVTQVDKHAQLYMHYPKGNRPETFNYVYYDERTGSIYATTAEPDSTIQGHWLHIRGKFTKNGTEFCGEYIIGGRGKSFNFCTKLHTKGK